MIYWVWICACCIVEFIFLLLLGLLYCIISLQFYSHMNSTWFVVIECLCGVTNSILMWMNINIWFHGNLCHCITPANVHPSVCSVLWYFENLLEHWMWNITLILWEKSKFISQCGIKSNIKLKRTLIIKLCDDMMKSFLAYHVHQVQWIKSRLFEQWTWNFIWTLFLHLYTIWSNEIAINTLSVYCVM